MQMIGVPAALNNDGVLPVILNWLRRQHYAPAHAEEVASRLFAHRDLWAELQTIIQTGAEPDSLTVAGVTYRSLRRRYKMTQTNALLTLAWLRSDPAGAKAALQEGIR